MSSSENAQALASLEAALNLLSEKLEAEPLNDLSAESDIDLIAEVNRLQDNQAEAKQALSEATALLRQLIS